MTEARDSAEVVHEVRLLAETLGLGVRWTANETKEEVSNVRAEIRRTAVFFEAMSKRRRGFPSEAQVKCGVRVVHGDKLLEEKLGRNDLCPCGSGKPFKKCCLKSGRF